MHIFLVGPPGIGKSSVAPLLAHHFGAALVELDREIERRAGKSCKDVIEQDGINCLRLESVTASSRRRRPGSWWTPVGARPFAKRTARACGGSA